MRLYHERQTPRGGALDTRDDEECFTTFGKRTGVWLSTERARGADAFSAEVDDDLVAPYEVTAEGAGHRVFVVPGSLVADWGFRVGS